LSVYLVTGGTGTLGTALSKLLLSQGHKVRVLARNEHGHERLRNEIAGDHHSRLSNLIGAVEDPGRLALAASGCDYVVHAAAQKSIPLAEYNPIQCIGTNIQGSINVIDACVRNHVKRAVLVSTDKASSPATLYGFTKATAERAWLNANRYSAGNEPHFVAVRYGNVWGSQGSVLHAWTKQAQYGHIEITDPQCTRFHITLSQAVSFVLDALGNAEAGELWVPRLPSYRLGDLAHAFRNAYGLSKQPSITGLRLSEKLHESMISVDESASLKAEEDLHYTLEPGVIHRKQGMNYNSGSNEWKLGVEALREEISQWCGQTTTPR
jgi:UDP-N-acetylglucosamine 4,6-dehydratase